VSAKRCIVVYATRAQQFQWPLELPAQASIADALAAARAAAAADAASAGAVIPWDAAPVGVFGERRERSATFADGDRIELYRSLRADPRVRRRERVQRERRGRPGTG
jgi:putative ubiquitin-RnfH superfamily antitoxin RatB of RatAB toxin-antitoxin module